MRAKGSSAVMAQRAPAAIEADDAQRALYRRLDFFPTPPWAARAGGELVKRLDPMAQCVWEPACGEGHMAAPLKEYFSRVIASDIHAHGYGEVIDFLSPSPVDLEVPVDWIITNPPFLTAADFIRRGLDIAESGVAVLVRLAFLESADRFGLLYGSRHPLTVLAPFSERVPMQLGSWDPELSSASAYAWFIFLKEENRRNDWAPRIKPIPPGSKQFFTRPDDIRRFAKPSPAPLFDPSPRPSPTRGERE